MPNTLIPIQSYTLGSSAASVTFSNIPQNYTDLKIVISGRDSSSAGTSDAGYSFTILPNGLTSNIVQRSMFLGGSGVSNFADTSMFNPIAMSADTANSFSNVEIYIQNYTSSNFKTFSIDGVTELNAGVAAIRISSGLWSQTTAISSLQLNAFSTWTAGSTFTLYGISNGVKATGGTLTVAGGYAYHTFTSTGSFLPSQQIKGAEILVVAGGGGGGSRQGGGGGAGGLVYSNSQTLNAGNAYTAMIGSGGAGATSGSGATGSNGTNSQFASLTQSIGGGGGGGENLSAVTPGGSGGGAGQGVSQTGSAGTFGQGFAGGDSGNNLGSAGGGGAGAVGTRTSGGIGLANYSVFGSVTNTGQSVGGVVYYAGGGGPGYGSRPGGLGGGGTGGAGDPSGTAGTAGTANTGGGGGGGGASAGTGFAGGTGGSGIVIVRYRLD